MPGGLAACTFALLEGVGRSGVETVFWGVLSVGVSAALAVLGFAVARRLVSFDLREAQNSNTAVMFGALYVMYGLIVGFSAYLVSYQYDTAQKTAQGEAGSVEEIHRVAEGFPEKERREVQELAESYARTVVDEGWPLMREGRTSARAGATADNLRRGVVAFEPRTEREDALYAQALTLMGISTSTGGSGCWRSTRASRPSCGSC